MKHSGIEHVIAQTLLTKPVRYALAEAGADPAGEDFEWRSWPQVFGSTTGPWDGYGGAAMTTFQVTLARRGSFAAVFAGSDLFAYGSCDDPTFWQQATSGHLNFDQLEDLGFVVFRRPLS